MLANKKVYVGKFSKEIQEKAFKLGWEWRRYRTTVIHTDCPFLYFNDNKTIQSGHNVDTFYNEHIEYQEVSPEWILSLEEPKPKKTLADLMPISGFYVDKGGEIKELNDHTQHYATELWNVLPTKEEAEVYKILPMLLHFRDRYNEGWKPNWTDDDEKHTIIVEGVDIIKDYCYNYKRLFTFKTTEIRDKFLEDFKEELEIVKPLL